MVNGNYYYDDANVRYCTGKRFCFYVFCIGIVYINKYIYGGRLGMNTE